MKPKLKIESPRAALPTKNSIQREIKKYLDMIPHTPEPNFGRVDELKQEIKKGLYPTQAMIDESAHHLAIRLLKGERRYLD